MIEPRDSMFEMHVAQSESVVAALDAMKQPRYPLGITAKEQFKIISERYQRMGRKTNDMANKSPWVKDCAIHRFKQLEDLLCDLSADCYDEDFEHFYPGVL